MSSYLPPCYSLTSRNDWLVALIYPFTGIRIKGTLPLFALSNFELLARVCDCTKIVELASLLEIKESHFILIPVLQLDYVSHDTFRTCIVHTC
jgi:hypothetical protein